MCAWIPKGTSTFTHAALREELVGYLQQAQAWARAVFFFSNPARVAVYHIGENLNANLPSIGQFSLDIRTSGVADALVGFTPAFLAGYDAARASLFAPEVRLAEPGPDDEAADVRDALEGMVEELTHDSMRIPCVADGVWTYGKPAARGRVMPLAFRPAVRIRRRSRPRR